MSTLGSRIRNFREKLGLSREQLAERAGLDPDFVSKIEDEDLYPSLGPLLKVSRALGVRLGTFLDDEQMLDPVIRRAAERTQELCMHPGGENHAELCYYSLGKGKADRHMEPFFIEIAPPAEDAADESLTSHEGEEFIVVVSGQLRVTIGREDHVLGAGDSIYFNSITPHHVGAGGKEPASIYAVLYFPQ